MCIPPCVGASPIPTRYRTPTQLDYASGGDETLRISAFEEAALHVSLLYTWLYT